MRNFIFGTSVATSGLVSAAAAGAVGVAMRNYNGLVFTDGSNFTPLQELYLVLKRDANDGGDIVLPLFANHFSYTKGSYSSATPYAAQLTIPDVDVDSFDYTVIAAKKGVKFNERNKFTANVHIGKNDTAATVASKIVKYFMDGSVARYGLTVSANGAVLTFAGSADGEDWAIIPADDLSGVALDSETHGVPALFDAKYIADLAAKAAADAGFEYTYQDDVHALYPKYPFNPLAASDSADTGFDVFTIRFAEPRKVKTVDDVVHQIIQIAVPMGDGDDLLDVLEALAGVSK